MASTLLVSSSLSFLVICDKSDLLQDIPTQLVADVLGRVKKGGVLSRGLGCCGLGRDGTGAAGPCHPLPLGHCSPHQLSYKAITETAQQSSEVPTTQQVLLLLHVSSHSYMLLCIMPWHPPLVLPAHPWQHTPTAWRDAAPT